MTFYKNGRLLCFFLSTLLFSSVSQAAVAEERKPPIDNKRFQFGVEYFSPTEGDRKIKTVNLNTYYLLK